MHVCVCVCVQICANINIILLGICLLCHTNDQFVQILYLIRLELAWPGHSYSWVPQLKCLWFNHLIDCQCTWIRKCSSTVCFKWFLSTLLFSIVVVAGIIFLVNLTNSVWHFEIVHISKFRYNYERWMLQLLYYDWDQLLNNLESEKGFCMIWDSKSRILDFEITVLAKSIPLTAHY